MVSLRTLSHHQASNSVRLVARLFVAFVSQYLIWMASQPRELRADANFKREAKLIAYGTCFVLLVVIIFILLGDVAMAGACAITWIGALVHLGRRSVCINIARLLQRFSPPFGMSVHFSSVLIPAESYISRDVTPQTQPPRL